MANNFFESFVLKTPNMEKSLKKTLDVSELETIEDIKKILDLLYVQASVGVIEENGLEKYFK